MKTRIYLVRQIVASKPDDIVTSYLVEATSRSQAERHVAAKLIQSEIAKPQDIVSFMGAGGKVETAKADTETAELPHEGDTPAIFRRRGA